MPEMERDHRRLQAILETTEAPRVQGFLDSGARGTRTPDLLGAIQADARADFASSAGYLSLLRALIGGHDFAQFPAISAPTGPTPAVFGPIRLPPSC